MHGTSYRYYKFNTVIVGTGAAGFNAADRLWLFGQQNIAIVTEHINAGTSRNTGSDKQTYYKLTLSGGDRDSVREMAQTLFDGQCVDGDIALCEAALSVQSFLRLCELGVPFPKNRYGEYIGYKTDHDPRRRATSVGPYTSREMTRCLEHSVKSKNIPIFDCMQVIKILSDGKQVYGLVCLDTSAQDPADQFVIFQCNSIIYATGGPAGIYKNSVYPVGHYGATGLAFEAGVKGRNLTEWQYGMASVRPKWNVSGTYMQVLPTFISTDPDGGNEREFLLDFFSDRADMLTKVFLKGYQWPFDVRKVADGSSIIDILVYLEVSSGRRVYLDFRSNPGGEDVDFDSLSSEAFDYLDKAGACFGSPIERLKHMNMPAVEFYRDRGVDLESERLEISLCAQHNNGGISINAWWETNLTGFFAVGEAAASHGVYRPGGSALNAGQVGSTRAAEFIAAHRSNMPEDSFDFRAVANQAVSELSALARQTFIPENSNVRKIWERETEQMSRIGASIRNSDEIMKAANQVKDLLDHFTQRVTQSGPHDLSWLFRLRDMLICQYVYLNAMIDYANQGGKSRGSALYTDPNGIKPYSELPETFRFVVDDGSRASLVQEVLYSDGNCSFNWRSVNPIPEDDDFFENVWRTYRENKNIY